MPRKIAFSALLLCSLTAHAGILSVSVGGSDGFTVYDNKQVNDQATKDSSVLTQAGGNGLSAISAQSSASFGVLKSATTLGSANPLGGGASWAVSRWEDTLRMNSASLIGQRATAIFTFAQSYMLDTVTYPSGWQVQSSMSNNVFIGSAYSATFSDVLTNYGTGFVQERTLHTTDARGRTQISPITNIKLIDLMVDFTWGEELRIGGQLQTSCVVGSRASSLYGGCTADAGHSSYWGGISSIVDASGNVINSYNLTSGSGTDYSKSMIPFESDVPEPATLPIILLGFASLSLFARKRFR